MSRTQFVAILLRSVAGAAIAACLSACAFAPGAPVPVESGLAGRVFDVREKRFIAREELFGRAAASRFIILGEIHDNPAHHRHQAEILASMVHGGRRPALAMEQFDREHQAGLDVARMRGERDPDAIADAGRFDRRGWRWPEYRPLVALAAENGLEIIAANLSREEARALIRSGRPHQGLAPAAADMRAGLEADIVNGHCGVRPPEATLAGMIEAQRGRDAQMAAAIEKGGPRGTLLIAGAGHARRSRGAPAYLAATMQDSLLVVAFVEVDPGQADPRAFFEDENYDVVWFTPRAEREDPCAAFRNRPVK